MSLQLYNTLTRTKEVFKPLKAPDVSIYVCGPTVYNFLHVGNFRGPVVFNLLGNWLEEIGYKPHMVVNFTDVDDRIITKAAEEEVKPTDISERYIAEYKKDFASLGLRPYEANPKVTESMPEIIAMIESLIQQDKAYVSGADVLYAVRAFPEYGKLSGRKVDDLQSGARVEVDEKKRDPLDFALWKGSKPGEPSWESPWGPGRPGWHIECSAMVCKHFGPQIDIHGGGTDLMFPHHENEIAQSEGATHQRFVGTWIHWQMLNFGGQKMSKSLGNFTTLRDFLKKHHPEIYKWMILSVHYRTTADFTPESLDRAVGGLARVYSALAVAEGVLAGQGGAGGAVDPAFQKLSDEAWAKISAALNDDLGTPEAFAAIFDLIRTFNTQVKRGAKVTPALAGKALAFQQLVQRFGKMLSLFQEPAAQFLYQLDDLLLTAKGLERAKIQSLVDERVAVRVAKDFAKSDELRDKLVGLGISLSDTPQGTFWEVAK